MNKYNKESWFAIVYVFCLFVIFTGLVIIFNWKVTNYLYWVCLIVVFMVGHIGINFIKRTFEEL